MPPSQPPLILASASPRRRSILRALGLTFSVELPTVDEVHWDERPEATVRENARRKCEWCRERHPASRIIAADTVVVFEGRCIAKPATREEAVTFLEQFSGKRQTVYTGTALYAPHGATEVSMTTSAVFFRRLAADDIRRYFERVHPMDKAGGYDINQYGDEIIASYEGSWSNIMGLPREAIVAWLRRVPLD